MNRLHPIFNTPSKNTVVSKYSKGDWVLLECRDTGLVYLDNPVDYEQLEQEFAWEKTYEQEREDRKKREPIFSFLSRLFMRMRKRIRKIPKIESLPIKLARERFPEISELNFLDVGCGTGAFSKRISEAISTDLQTRVIPRGIEISKALASEANESLASLGGEVVQASAVEGMKQLQDRSQHIVVMHSFLEHEVNPRDLLRACADKLTADGLLIIKVPNFSCWNRKIRQAKWCGFRYPDHVNYFSPSNMRLLFRETGLGVYRMNFFDRIPTSDNMWIIAQVADSD